MEIYWTRRALRQLDELTDQQQRAVVIAVERVANGDVSQVRKLSGLESLYRIRVGRWRVIYHRASRGPITIEEIVQRKDAY